MCCSRWTVYGQMDNNFFLSKVKGMADRNSMKTPRGRTGHCAVYILYLPRVTVTNIQHERSSLHMVIIWLVWMVGTILTGRSGTSKAHPHCSLVRID